MNKQTLHKINSQIKLWSDRKPKSIIAIDGYTGVGKTTLLNNLHSINKDILAVHRDDFLISRNKLQRLLKKAKDKSKVFELAISNYKKIEKLITAFQKGKRVYTTKTYNTKTGKIDIKKSYNLSKKVMVIEDVFMFHPKLLNHLWNKRIYLMGDIRKIDKQRVLREKKKWGKDYFPETHPDSYFRQVTIAYKRYQKKYRPEKKADLVIKI
jgi:uridine kinase